MKYLLIILGIIISPFIICIYISLWVSFFNWFTETVDSILWWLNNDSGDFINKLLHRKE